MTTGRELQEIREAELLARRTRQTWPAALGGRSGLPAPLRKSRQIGYGGSVGFPSIRQVGEIFVFRQRVIALEESDDYPVLVGGRPRVVVQMKTAPSSDIEIELSRNGSPIEDPIVISSAQTVVQFETVFYPLDYLTFETIDIGADGAGLVAAGHFLPALAP